MSFLGQTFDASQVDPNSQFEPLPSGEYPAMIIESEMKPTKNNAGQYLELKYQIIDGPFKGRQVWARLNLDNPNATAVQIAQQNLSAICHACSRLQVNDSAQLHNIPHLVRVEFLPASPKRERAGNEIRGWKAIAGVTGPIAAPAPAPTSSPFQGQAQTYAPPAPAAAPAWANKTAA